jgi:uncharacterized protein YndB with AHSA1/START domain
MSEHIELHAHFPIKPETLFDALLDSSQHSAMTGADAQISDQTGAPFSASDGYIRGVNLELERPRRIVQAWRTSDFRDQDADSRVEWLLRPAKDGGTDLCLRHTGLPDGTHLEYQQGWMEYYFTPMQEYCTLRQTT